MPAYHKSQKDLLLELYNINDYISKVKNVLKVLVF
jgi:hypothetical protein